MAALHHSPAPETRYADSGGVSIAYQAFGDGPIDLVLVPGFPSHLEHAWEHPKLAHFYHRLASFSRLTLLDKRGAGLSDRVASNELPGIEQRKDDLKAVLDEVGAERATLVAASDGGPLALLFGATYPERTESLVVINTYARRLMTDDYRSALTPAQWEAFINEAESRWGEPVFVEEVAPRSAADPEFRNWWSAFLRRSMSPGAALAMLRMNAAMDVRAALPAIHVPTLVVHRTGDRVCPVDGGRYIADQIDGARFLELPGNDHLPWLGDAEAILDEIEEFVTGDRAGTVPSFALASMLFTDVVASTETAAELGNQHWSALMKTHDGIVQGEVTRFGGRTVKHTGDGSLSVFEGPARAVRCGLSIADRLRDIGLEIRGGVHTSEVEMVDGDVRGLGVHIAARLMALATPGELMVSSVVRDLSVGSGLEFVDRGRRQLKGVPSEWHVFAVTR